MKVIADLHIHSAYSRGCSRALTLENISKWCDYKGIKIVATGDFTHPLWFKEIKSKLIEVSDGLYHLKDDQTGVYFMLGTEISCIYKQGDKTRRVHVCLLTPKIEAVEKLIANFIQRGFNLKSDGRPIIGLPAKALAEIMLEIEPKSLIIPAHAWTPWFSVFGSKSGFDSLAECFENITPEIYAIETGLSSDPAMNWRVRALDKITLISNSDAHSLNNLGREANVFEIAENNFNYQEIYRIIKAQDRQKFLSTIEFFPEEGKYHLDGHADCHFSCLPAVSKKNKNFCPHCGKELILGVLHRVDDLADRQDLTAVDKVPFQRVIPLAEIMSAVYGVGKNSKKIMNEYFKLVEKKSEFDILIDLPASELKKIMADDLRQAILNVRSGRVKILPGYDGIFGQISFDALSKKLVQNGLF